MTHVFTLTRETAKAALVACLCLTLAMPEAIAEGVPVTNKTRPLTQSERTLHALNRLTFGPRPGEEAAVTKMGLDAWFERQLHPEKIDDSAFDARLEEFPAMKLSQAQLIQDFPSPLRMRVVADGRREMPSFSDPVESAIYADYLARYKFGQALQAKGLPANGAGAQTMNFGVSEMAAAANSGSMENSMQAAGVMAPGTTPAPLSPQARVPGTLRNAAFMDAVKEAGPISTMTPKEMQAIVELPPAARFQRVVALSPSDHLRFMVLAAPRLQQMMAGFTSQQKEAIGAMVNPIRVVSTETLESRLLRDVYSERQLQAVMTDFWLNHFSVYIRKNQNEVYLLNSYQKDTVLPHSLGNFEQLLVATAESPAMLMYLDNWESVGPDSPAAQRALRAKKAYPNNPLANRASAGINENYARELMELHTVGVNGGYTQKDVIEVAKCFTGWTINRPYGATDGDDAMAFRFDPSRHEGGSKVVMGVTIPEGGMQEGLTVLHMLATSPRTARFISQKLAVRFVADNPPPSLVDKMAATFTKTNGDIPAVLSTMFHAPEFWAPSVYRAKVKTPIEFLVSALRAADTNVTNAGLLVQAADRLGMPVYGMQTPNGYSWKSEDWVSSGALVNRMNFALVLSGNHIRGSQTDWTKLLNGSVDAAAPSSATEKNLEFIILGEEASAKTRDTVLNQFKNSAVQEEAQKNFELAEKGPTESEDDGGGMAGAQGRLRRSAFQAYGRDGGLNLNAQPATPLDTMAGLLLGSPDFQRR